MRKKPYLAKIVLLLAALTGAEAALATDLVEVYQDALTSDPIYQQAISQRLATKEGVPINMAALLPSLSLNYTPTVTRSGYSGTNVSTGSSPRNNTLRYYNVALTLSQTVFNYSQYMSVQSALSTSNQADAILNAALQSLIVRVATAYFNVLRDEDDLSFNEASVLAYKEQLEQIKQQFKVGIKTITDVYTAQASYDSSVANYIAVQTRLTNNKENLRAITGKYYDHFAPLSEDFPLVAPTPADDKQWVHTALLQNWNLKASQYAVDSARQIVRQQFGGHLPTVALQGSINRQYSDNINYYNQALNQRNGPSTETDRTISVNVSLPIFSGGAVVAQTNQAVYNYQTTQQQLEQTERSTVSTTRQSYFGVISGISQVKADKEAVKSTISSLRGMEESFNVGAETLVNVLNQQQKVFESQTKYAADRYNFVINYLSLKQAAGTLGFNDLHAINVWLHDDKSTIKRRSVHQYQPKKAVLSGKHSKSPNIF